MNDLAQTITTIYLFASSAGFLLVGAIFYLMSWHQLLGIKPVSGDIWLAVIGTFLMLLGVLLYMGGSK